MNRTNVYRAGRSAFTLLELLLVVVIIGILAAAVIPSLAGRSQQARSAAAKQDIFGALGTSLDMFANDTGGYPTTEQGLKALVIQPAGVTNWLGPYIKSGQLSDDPWGNAYVYTYPSQKNPTLYELISKGPDGKLGTDDDISCLVVKKTTTP